MEKKKFATEIDPVSGYPKEDKPLDSSKSAVLLERQARAELLKASIASETGQTLLGYIQEVLLARVKVLMENDAESKSLVKILTNMGLTIDIGQEAVNRLMKKVIKK